MKVENNIKTLKELCHNYKADIVDGPFGSSMKRSDYFTEGVPVLKIQNIKPFKIELKNTDFVKKEKYEELKRHSYKKGDIILTKLGAPLGASAIVEDIDNGLIVADLVRIRAGKINTRYLCYHLNSPLTNNFINSQQQGATRPRVQISVVRDLPIFTPTLPEQQRIVSILDEAFTAIDQAKENLQRNLQNAKELFQSELNIVFSNKEKSWEEKTLNQISENLDNKRIPITKNVRSSGEYPYYGASGIVDYVGEYIFNDDLLLVSEDGANLLARTYPIAFPISGKSWVNNHAHVLKFKNIVTQNFVEYYVNSIKLNPFVSGMAHQIQNR